MMMLMRSRKEVINHGETRPIYSPNSRGYSPILFRLPIDGVLGLHWTLDATTSSYHRLGAGIGMLGGGWKGNRVEWRRRRRRVWERAWLLRTRDSDGATYFVDGRMNGNRLFFPLF